MTEKISPEEKAPDSSRELAPLAPVIFIYRDNDLFESVMPEIVKHLQSSGRQVEVQAFPREMDLKTELGRQEIKDWFQSHADDLSNKEVILDGTLKQLGKVRQEIRGEHENNLDKLLERASVEVMLGVPNESVFEITPLEKEQTWTDTEKGVVSIISRILEDGIPDRVRIKEDRLLDHAPLSELSSEEEAVQKIKEWLIMSGVPEKAFERPKDEDIKPKKFLTIADRHNPYTRNRDTISQEGDKVFIFLPLPLASMYSAAKNAGLLKLKPDEIKKYEEKVKEMFDLELKQ